jgi:hypothetical protein
VKPWPGGNLIHARQGKYLVLSRALRALHPDLEAPLCRQLQDPPARLPTNVARH